MDGLMLHQKALVFKAYYFIIRKKVKAGRDETILRSHQSNELEEFLQNDFSSYLWRCKLKLAQAGMGNPDAVQVC